MTVIWLKYKFRLPLCHDPLSLISHLDRPRTTANKCRIIRSFMRAVTDTNWRDVREREWENERVEILFQNTIILFYILLLGLINWTFIRSKLPEHTNWNHQHHKNLDESEIRVLEQRALNETQKTLSKAKRDKIVQRKCPWEGARDSFRLKTIMKSGVTVQKWFIYWTTMEPSRSINHETEASSSTAINCNNASIIQNPSIRYDLRKPQSSGTQSPVANVLLHSSSSRTDNNGYGRNVGGGGGGGSSTNTSATNQRSKSGGSDRSTFHTLHYENPNDNIIITNRKMHTANLNRHRRNSQRARNAMHDGNDSYSSKSTASSYSSTCSASSCDGSDTSSNSSGEPNLPYPGFPELSMNYLTQEMRPRNWCLLLITNPWFERVSILVILFNCVTLGMYQPCVDDECVTNRCKILQVNTSTSRHRWAFFLSRSRRVLFALIIRATSIPNIFHRLAKTWHKSGAKWEIESEKESQPEKSISLSLVEWYRMASVVL